MTPTSTVLSDAVEPSPTPKPPLKATSPAPQPTAPPPEPTAPSPPLLPTPAPTLDPSARCLPIAEVYDPQLGCIAAPPTVQFDIWGCTRTEGRISWICTWSGPATWCPVRLITHPECVSSQQDWTCAGWGDITNYTCVLSAGLVCGGLGGECFIGDRPDIGYASCFRIHTSAPWTCPQGAVAAFECNLPTGLIPDFTDRAFCWSESVLP